MSSNQGCSPYEIHQHWLISLFILQVGWRIGFSFILWMCTWSLISACIGLKLELLSCSSLGDLFSKLLGSIGRDASDELMQKLMIIYEGIWKRRNDTLSHTGNSTRVFSMIHKRNRKFLIYHIYENEAQQVYNHHKISSTLHL